MSPVEAPAPEVEMFDEPELLVKSDPDPFLLEVARLLRGGWAQDYAEVVPPIWLRLLGAKRRYCLWGAYHAAAGAHPRPLSLVGFADVLGFTSDVRLAEWNDANGRTQDEVVERVERAAYGL